jgi:hypothetical protein
MEHYYIVWRNPFFSYALQGDGYFVKYKDKLSDWWSTDYRDAAKYKTLGPAISRLNIEYNKATSIYNFIKANTPNTKSAHRDCSISNVLGESVDISTVLSWRGRIDKVSKDYEFLGNAEEEVIKHIEKTIIKNHNAIESRMLKIGEAPIDIDYTTSEYQNEFDNFFGL